jgi:TPR repeat protein
MHQPKTTLRFRSALLLSGLFALWGSAVAQTLREPYTDVSDSSAATATALNPATKSPPQFVPVDSSIDTLRKKADAGDAGAQGLLGDAYYKGEGVERDVVEAAKWFRKSADQGDDMAQFFLGRCYANGEGVEKNPDEAAKWLRKSVGQGNAKAQSLLKELANEEIIAHGSGWATTGLGSAAIGLVAFVLHPVPLICLLFVGSIVLMYLVNKKPS